MNAAVSVHALLLGAALAGAGCVPAAAVRTERPRLVEPGCGAAPDRGVIAEIRGRVASARAAGETPLVVFDLDDTLVDTAPRTRAILVEALRSPSAPAGVDQASEQLDYVCLAEYSTDIAATLDRGDFRPNIRRHLLEAWSRYGATECHLDRAVPLPGAATFVAELRTRGATIVYLTNRNGRRLREGTLRALDARGFPVVRDGALVVMQPGDGEDSLSWKEEEAEKLPQRGTVVATFENEPPNAAMYRRLFPEAVGVLVVTRHRPNPPPVPQGTRCILDYRE